MIQFFVAGEARAKQSFRVTSPGHGYTPARVKAWQADVGWIGKQCMNGAGYPPMIGDLAVRLYFHLSGGRRRIDLDNLSKAVLDGLNRICWIDDDQVMFLMLGKQFNSTEPGVEVWIADLTNDEALGQMAQAIGRRGEE